MPKRKGGVTKYDEKTLHKMFGDVAKQYRDAGEKVTDAAFQEQMEYKTKELSAVVKAIQTDAARIKKPKKSYNKTNKAIQDALKKIDWKSVDVSAVKTGEASLWDLFRKVQKQVAIEKPMDDNAAAFSILRKEYPGFKTLTKEEQTELKRGYMAQEWFIALVNEKKLNTSLLRDSAFPDFCAYYFAGDLGNFTIDNMPAYMMGDINKSLNQVIKDKAMREGKQAQLDQDLFSDPFTEQYGNLSVGIQNKTSANSSFSIDYAPITMIKHLVTALDEKAYGLESYPEKIARFAAETEDIRLAQAKSTKKKKELNFIEKWAKENNIKAFMQHYVKNSAAEYYLFSFENISYDLTNPKESGSRTPVAAQGLGGMSWGVSMRKDELINYAAEYTDMFSFDVSSRKKQPIVRFKPSAIKGVDQLFTRHSGHYAIHYGTDNVFYRARAKFLRTPAQIANYNTVVKGSDDFKFVHEVQFGGLLNPVYYDS